jgi:hypothetical protein
MAVDWTDPCARANALRGAYYALISGSSESLIKHSTTEGDQEVRFARADLGTLKVEMAAAEVECAQLNGTAAPTRARRFAIRGGGRRSNRPLGGDCYGYDRDGDY